MKKYKALTKDIFKEIWKTRSRFLSILLIVMLGSGFFAGVKSTCPNMKDTAEKYFKDQNLFDLQLKSTMGFTQNDIDLLKNQADTKELYAGYTADLFTKTIDKEGNVTRLYSIDLSKTEAEDTINRLVLLEGRMPQSTDECVLDQSALKGSTVKVGDKISFYPESGKDIKDILVNDEFTVVGIVRAPMYINFERGKTTMGNGSIASTAYISEKAFAYEVYTDIFLTYKSLHQLKFFDDAYGDLVASKTADMEIFGDTREKTRHDEIYDEALIEIEKAEKELNDGIEEYNANKFKFETEIEDAQAKLQKAKADVDKGTKELSANTAKINDGFISYYQGEKELTENRTKLESAMAELDDGLQKLSSLSDLSKSIGQTVLAYENIALDKANPMPEELSSLVSASENLNVFTQNQFDFKDSFTKYLYAVPQSEEKYQLKTMLLSVTDGAQSSLSSQKEQLMAQKTQISDNMAKINQGFETLESTRLQLEDGQKQLAVARRKLADGKTEYEKGIKELEKNKTEGEQKLKDAEIDIEKGKSEILDARHDLNELGSPEWYIFDRTDNPGYGEFSDDAERVDRIAKVFPVFFIIVAALVCLTTMTRMVEEQRTEIGTLKSLGYGKGASVAKYLVYAISATLIGSILGLLLGFNILPKVIFNAYRIMYVLPDVLLPFRWDYALWCTGIASLVTGLAAYSACSLELREVSAQLLRPKPPKTGKRVLLERVGFIWKRLSFLQKVTARNLFRYKKRIYMTVVGVAGCTALMMAGFGLQHSITSIVDRQYDEIFIYDALGISKDNLSSLELNEIDSQLKSNPNILSHRFILQENMTFSFGKNKHEAYLFVPSSLEDLPQYIKLRERSGHKELPLSNDGIIINEKLSKLLDISVGESLLITLDSGSKKELKVTGISENYLMNYVYMTPEKYKEITGSDYKTNAFIMNMGEGYDKDDFSTGLLKNNNILAVSYSSDGGAKFRDIVGSLNYIVLVLIICAGSLAFVVLYNLANINVEERLREIATIKVLGFYDREVSSYIFRESIISAMMGMLLGLVLGIPFLKFIIQTAEVDAVMFNPQINAGSFIYSSLLTVIFTLIVNYATHFRLKRVDMVSSLKSVE